MLMFRVQGLTSLHLLMAHEDSASAIALAHIRGLLSKRSLRL